MTEGPRGRRVREPVQVYLDEVDRSLLEELAARTGLPRAELLRRGLRRMADEVLTERAPGWSFDRVVGVLGDDPALPRPLEPWSPRCSTIPLTSGGMCRWRSSGPRSPGGS